VIDVIDVSEDLSPPDPSVGLLLPVPDGSKNGIVFEPRDGANVRTLDASAVTLTYRGERVVGISGVHASVILTDARVAVACSNYDTGGGWIGSPALMGVFNTASKIRAAVRSHGKVLVGQARYPWIARVGSTAKLGFGSAERLVIEASEGDGQTYRLLLDLRRDIGAEVAAELVQRAASFKLRAEPDLDPTERLELERLTAAQPIPTTPARGASHIYFHDMPTCWYISERSALFTPQ
jgi:hypothetical protein